MGRQSGSAPDKLRINLPQAKLWSPDQPYLYTLRLQYAKDSAESYFGMRSVAVVKDSAGVDRFSLNGRQCFTFGLLDQGYWPDGLQTTDVENEINGLMTYDRVPKIDPASIKPVVTRTISDP